MFRLYSEHVPLPAIDSALLGQLAARGVELAVAVFPGNETELRHVVQRADAAGVSLVLWPLLHDDQGRWPNGGNVRPFAEHVGRLTRDMRPTTVLFDVEPPIAWTRAAVHWRYAPRARGPRTNAGSHAPLANQLRERGWRVEAVVPPMVLYGPQWERLLGTPVSDLGCERVEPMAYTSLLEGYSRGLVPRRVARDLLVRMTRRGSGSVALGVVGGGAIGDEPAYRNVDELREDVAIARAAGATQLSLYALDEMVARGNIESWLDAFVTTPAGELPPATRRGELLEQAFGLVGR